MATPLEDLDEAAKATIIADYKAGIGSPTLAARYGVHFASVLGFLRRNGVEIRRLCWVDRLSEEDKANIGRMLGENVPGTQIAAQYGVDFSSFYKYIRRLGLTPKGTFRRKKCVVNHNAFDDPHNNPEAAYWIGVLLTDGCVHHPKDGRNPTVTLGFKASDLAHVEAFRSFLGANHKIGWQAPAHSVRNGQHIHGTGSHAFACTSKKLAEQLLAYGISPRKSCRAHIQGGLEGNPHTWRGAIDGDGSIMINKRGRPRIELCGSRELIDQFAAFAQTVSPSARSKAFPMNSIWKISYKCSTAVPILRALYEDAPIALERKRVLAVQGMAWKRMEHTTPTFSRVAKMTAAGLSPRDIASVLGITPEGVHYHLRKIRESST